MHWQHLRLLGKRALERVTEQMHSYVVYFAVAIIHWHKKALIQRALAAWLSNLTLGVTTEQRSQHKYAAG